MTAPAWPPVGVRQRLIDLRSTRDALKNVDSSSDFFLEQCMARYLAVRSAGYIEAVRDDVADQFTAQKAAIEVVRRTQENLRTGEGVRPSQLEKFVKSFSPEWAAELSILFDQADELKSGLGSLVAARKKIAHGDGERVTTSNALNWCDIAEQMGKWLVARFDPSASTTEPCSVNAKSLGYV